MVRRPDSTAEFPAAVPCRAAASLFFAGLFSVAVCGCGAGPRSRLEALQRAETADAEFAAAREAQLDGRIDDARRIYSDLTIARPLNAMAHLQLGILLQDSAGDPVGAIGQYEAYLRLAPDSEKETLVRERLQLSRDQVARRHGAIERASASDADVERVSSELAAVKAELDSTRDALAEAEAQRDKAQDDVLRLHRTISGLQRQIDILQGGGAPVRGSSAVPPTGDGARTSRVKRGDALLSIAQRTSGDATRNRDIRDANPGKVGEGDVIREGDVLVLP